MSNSGSALANLAQEINEHDKARRACEIKGVMHACRIGQLLIEAKDIVPHDGFLDWLKANTAVTPRMCQMYMAIARDRFLTERIEREYETVSHLTIAKAVKLAKQHRTLDEVARHINELSAKLTENQQKISGTLGEVQQTFTNERDFKSWIVNVGFSQAFTEKVPELLAVKYDDWAWTDALLADLETRMVEAQS
jgi:hypothetical protein